MASSSATAAATAKPAQERPTVPSEPAAVTVLLDATVIDGTGGKPLPHAVVVLEKDKVKEVGPLAKVEIPDGAVTHKLTGKWIVPGLVDAHIHLFQSAGLYARPDIVDLSRVRPYKHEAELLGARLPETLRRYLASGVTAVVDVGSPMWSFEVREAARAEVVAPRVAVAGPLISTVSRQSLDAGDPPIVQAKSAEEARELVKKQLLRKPDLLKVWFIVPPKADFDELLGIVQAAIAEAHRESVRVAVHATELDTARAAVEAGADVLVHSVDDETIDGPLIGLLKARNVIYIPTLAVYEGYSEVLGQDVRLSDIERRYGDPQAVDSWRDFAVVPSATPEREIAERRVALEKKMPVQRKNLGKVFRSGVTIAAGTDAGNIGTLHGAALHRELELMAEAGMSPSAVLVAATKNAAQVFSKTPSFGTIEKGKIADLLVVDADPLTDVRHLQRIHRVVKGGIVLEPRQILPPNPAYVVQAQVDAYNSRNVDEFVSLYAPDAVVTEQPIGKEIAAGHTAIKAVYGKLFEANSELHCEVLQRITIGSTVVDHELVTGIAGRPHVRAMARYEVADGLIRSVSVTRGPSGPEPSAAEGKSAPGDE
ncbi:MAG: amidohydrolase family protein [Deltaproteobacteria bacterium]|nr:amidohydrolase family protein [Deltaproteobacteria bacterium]MBW2532315.1 amidohydrolase family protein [Deltaproteobacteria bacterium]